MSFSIHDVKSVREVYNEDDANEYLRNGWVLLSVGFDTEDDITGKVYILGTTKYAILPPGRGAASLIHVFLLYRNLVWFSRLQKFVCIHT